MAVNPKTFTFDKARLAKVIALYEYLRKVNNDPAIRYSAFNAPENGIAYTDPDSSYFTADTMKLINDAAEKRGDTEPQPNAPNIDDFMDLMLFIEAVNAGEAVYPEGFPKNLDDFDLYVQKPQQEQLDLLSRPRLLAAALGAPAALITNYQRQLANAMLNEVTRFRERSFAGVDEQMSSSTSTVTAEDKKTYALFSSMHARALNRIGSGKGYKEEGESTGGRMLGVLLRAAIILPFYPLFIVVGGIISFGMNSGARLDEGKAADDDYTSRFYGILSGMSYRMGDAGEKYWVQAGLNMPKIRPWDSVANVATNLIHNPLSVLSIVLTTIPEFISKSILWPFKAIVGYDRLATDSLLRQGINGFENTLTGILSSPIILINNLYRAVLDVGAKTFTMPENDPDLQKISKWLSDNTIFGIDLKNPSLGDWVFIALFKPLRLIFDTIPAILTPTIMNTLRSILPAMPGTTKEFRDTSFKWMSRALYGGLFTITALFLGGAFLAGIGVTVPGWLGVIFGYDPSTMGHGAGQFASAYGNQIWNAMQTVANGFASTFSGVAQAFGNFFVTHLNPANIGSVFSQGGLMGPGGPISNAFLSIGSKAAIAATVIGSVFGLATAVFVGEKTYKWWGAKSKDENSKKDEVLSVDDSSAVRVKIEKSAVVPEKPGDKPVSKLAVVSPQEKMRQAVIAKADEKAAAASAGSPSSGGAAAAATSKVVELKPVGIRVKKN